MLKENSAINSYLQLYAKKYKQIKYSNKYLIVSKDEYIVIAIDSNGIKVTNRGHQWMRDKWHIKNKKKVYLKIHVDVNVKTKEILSIKVTDEHVHDGKVLPELVNEVIKSDRMISIGNLIADSGAYEGNEIFRYSVGDKGIQPCIKVRKRMVELN